mmetsp:Transcript_99323/g.303716  ORF Transcript_99323/g.303716 Transcript_99323/m.303716 type:complete len:252 (+) Transcript_99323:536-1291(+)
MLNFGVFTPCSLPWVSHVFWKCSKRSGSPSLTCIRLPRPIKERPGMSSKKSRSFSYPVALYGRSSPLRILYKLFSCDRSNGRWPRISSPKQSMKAACCWRTVRGSGDAASSSWHSLLTIGAASVWESLELSPTTSPTLGACVTNCSATGPGFMGWPPVLGATTSAATAGASPGDGASWGNASVAAGPVAGAVAAGPAVLLTAAELATRREAAWAPQAHHSALAGASASGTGKYGGRLLRSSGVKPSRASRL